MEILEKGLVRFWMQAEKLSANAKVNYIFNEKEIFEGPVGSMHFTFINVLSWSTTRVPCRAMDTVP